MTKNLSPKRVAIIGGGISGLSTAYYLWRESPKTDVTLFEASAQIGGLIHTEEADDFIIENGPDCFISEKPAGVELSLDLGLRDELIGTRKQFPQSFILSKGKLEPIPHDFYLMAPRNYPALFKSPLLSWKGKLRAACEPFIAPHPPTLPSSHQPFDESLASFVRRRLGQEVLEKLAQPLIGGIYGADPEKLSLRSTFPTFLEMEKNSGSLWKGQRLARQRKKTSQASGARYDLFLSFKQGMRTILDALISELEDVTSLRTETPIESLSFSPKTRAWHLTTADREQFTFDAICLSLPAYQSAKLLEKITPSLAQELRKVDYGNSAILNLAYPLSEIKHPLNGYGFVVPRIEQKTLLACSFLHQKFDGRAPEGYALLRCFAGGPSTDGVWNMDDKDLLRTLRNELKIILGIQGTPVLQTFTRYEQRMPHYHVGHQERIQTIQTMSAQTHGLYLTGNWLQGVGIPDCISHAKRTAQQLGMLLPSR